MDAQKKEQELHETHRKLKEAEEKQDFFMKELDHIMENEQKYDQQFDAIQEEINDTTHKLKTLWKKYQSKVGELKDLEEENEIEEQELSENIKALTRQFQLKSLILDYFIPCKWLEFIEEHSQWDPNIDQWRIPALEYSGNNMAPQRVMAMEDGESEELTDLEGVGIGGDLHGSRPLTHKRMVKIWERVRTLTDDEHGDVIRMERGYQDIHEVPELNEEIQEAIYVAMNTNMDPNQNGEKVYLTYGVDMDTLKKRAKSRKKV